MSILYHQITYSNTSNCLYGGWARLTSLWKGINGCQHNVWTPTVIIRHHTCSTNQIIMTLKNTVYNNPKTKWWPVEVRHWLAVMLFGANVYTCKFHHFLYFSLQFTKIYKLTKNLLSVAEIFFQKEKKIVIPFVLKPLKRYLNIEVEVYGTSIHSTYILVIQYLYNALNNNVDFKWLSNL